MPAHLFSSLVLPGAITSGRLPDWHVSLKVFLLGVQQLWDWFRSGTSKKIIRISLNMFHATACRDAHDQGRRIP